MGQERRARRVGETSNAQSDGGAYEDDNEGERAAENKESVDEEKEDAVARSRRRRRDMLEGELDEKAGAVRGLQCKMSW